MSRWRWRVLTVAVLAVCGTLFLVSGKTAQGQSLRPDGHTELSDLVRSASHKSQQLTERVENLRNEVDELAASEQNPNVAEAQKAVEDLLPAAGLTAVKGPGLTVTLDDAPLPGNGKALPPDTTYDDYVVHQQDLEGVMNAMWAGGAEAMMIMDQRIISTSAVRCVGNVLILQGQVYSPPFTITAIGDVDGMQEALDESPAVATYRRWANFIGLGYKVEEKTEIDLPAYGGSLELTSAETVSK